MNFLFHILGPYPSTYIFNRPRVAWANLQTSLLNWFILNWVGHPSVQNLQDTVYPKPKELGSWNCEKMFTPPPMCHMSQVMCQMSGLRYQVSGVGGQVSGVRCHFFIQSGLASCWRVCYKRGLPRLVSHTWLYISFIGLSLDSVGKYIYYFNITKFREEKKKGYFNKYFFFQICF